MNDLRIPSSSPARDVAAASVAVPTAEGPASTAPAAQSADRYNRVSAGAAATGPSALVTGRINGAILRNAPQASIEAIVASAVSAGELTRTDAPGLFFEARVNQSLYALSLVTAGTHLISDRDVSGPLEFGLAHGAIVPSQLEHAQTKGAQARADKGADSPEIMQHLVDWLPHRSEAAWLAKSQGKGVGVVALHTVGHGEMTPAMLGRQKFDAAIGRARDLIAAVRDYEPVDPEAAIKTLTAVHGLDPAEIPGIRERADANFARDNDHAWSKPAG